MSYGGDIADSWCLVGVYAGRVPKGERPFNVPMQRATKIDFINRKTAQN